MLTNTTVKKALKLLYIQWFNFPWLTLDSHIDAKLRKMDVYTGSPDKLPKMTILSLENYETPTKIGLLPTLHL